MRTYVRVVRIVCTAALIVMLSWAWTLAPHVGGSEVVTITSPASGSTVAGTIAVSAAVGVMGTPSVAGVQFKLDGANLDAEDVAAPYEILWETAAVSDGSHTLTAVARDTLGFQYTSDPVQVTVSNAVMRFEETSASVTVTGAWASNTDRTWSGRSAAVSSTEGARLTVAFSGTSVNWIGFLGPMAGIARVALDGAPAVDVDLYAPTEEVRAVVFAAGNLANTAHTLTVEVSGLQNAAATGAFVVVDAFDVPGPRVMRIQETDPSLHYTGNWIRQNPDRAWSGGTAAESITAGDTVTFTFTGTSVSWIGARASQGAIARVYLDGVFVSEVDTYATTEEIQQVVFTAGGLVNATHTLTIEMTGLRNPASRDLVNLPTLIVDAFEVTL